MDEAGRLRPRHSVGTTIANWVAWSAATLFVTYQLAVQNSIGAMQRNMEADLSLSTVQITVVSASFLFVYAAVQIPAGLLLDRFRPRRLLPPMALGVAASAWMLSGADGFWSAVLARSLMGAFAAFAFPGAGLVSRRRLPLSQFALAMGLVDMAFGAGGLLGDAGVDALLRVQSWRAIMVDFALAGALVALVCWLFIGSTSSRGESATGEACKKTLLQSFREVIAVRQVRLACVVASALMAMLFGFGTLWDVPLQQAYGYNHTEAVWLNSWLFIGVTITPPIVGWAADRWRIRRPILFGGQALALVAIVGILGISTEVPFWFAAGNLALLGVGIGVTVLTFPIACDAVEPSNAGAAIGLVNASGLFAAAVFQILPGILLTAFDSHSLATMRVVFGVFVAVVVVGMLATHMMDRCPAQSR
ncbi:MAG: MFS transporter [Phycisphaerales bacterium]|nr:MFS transporter [Phycisphaerales bacterium]